jgi:hypothetical protein
MDQDSKQGGIKEQWNPSNDQYIGLANAKAQITRHYLDAFRNALPKIFKQITDQLEDTQRQILLAEQSVKLSDPCHLQQLHAGLLASDTGAAARSTHQERGVR